MKKRFSVIITAHNIQSYIARAVNSVLHQTYSNFEIIVVDDCSEDETVNEVNKIKDRRIKLLSTDKNSGTAAGPRNLALDNAVGEYIIFLDGDDELFDENVLLKISNLIGFQAPDIVFLGYQDAGNGDKYRLSNAQNSTKDARILCDVSFSVSSKVWSRNFIEENQLRFVEGLYYEDMLFSIKSNIISQNTIHGEFPIFRYHRNRPNSIMTTASIKKCFDLYRVMAEITDLYDETPDEYKKQLLSFIKNENESIPRRMANNIYAYETGKDPGVMPKREYQFTNFFENN